MGEEGLNFKSPGNNESMTAVDEKRNDVSSDGDQFFQSGDRSTRDLAGPLLANQPRSRQIVRKLPVGENVNRRSLDW
ncbi:hypothetical protein WN51_14399 [Melipona quadrifasciata]|uniref:Uncharacterized protein n=1 Tax=Melipona quadrifasciata TaxID=166423 RepID=A0A0M9A0F6_9HYME|nr:hypothetical protein WN51_14399 [Melipona quadrifasciata]